MIRFRRTIFQACAWVSLLLLVATSLVAIRSYRIADQWGTFDIVGRGERASLRAYNAELARGKIAVGRQVITSNEFLLYWMTDIQNDYGHHRRCPTSEYDHEFSGMVNGTNKLGFKYRSGTTNDWPGPTMGQTLCIRLWAPAGLFSVLPLVAAIRRLRRRRTIAQGLCEHCGYDLRESPQRCPECGSDVLPPPRPTIASRITPIAVAILLVAGATSIGWMAIRGAGARQTATLMRSHLPHRLFGSIRSGDARGFADALRDGADPNACDIVALFGAGHGYPPTTPLGCAIVYHRHAMLAELLRWGADPNARDDGLQQVPLHYACKLADRESVRLLVAAGAKVSDEDRAAVKTLLRLSTDTGAR